MVSKYQLGFPALIYDKSDFLTSHRQSLGILRLSHLDTSKISQLGLFQLNSALYFHRRLFPRDVYTLQTQGSLLLLHVTC